VIARCISTLIHAGRERERYVVGRRDKEPWTKKENKYEEEEEGDDEK
jgi:hypothetical protein